MAGIEKISFDGPSGVMKIYLKEDAPLVTSDSSDKCWSIFGNYHNKAKNRINPIRRGCEFKGCQCAKNVSRRHGGLFCRKHRRYMTSLRSKFKKHNLPLEEEIYWRQTEVICRSTICRRHTSYIDRLISKTRGFNGTMIEYPNGDKHWYRNNKLHRMDGPAVEKNDGTKIWYVDGKPL